MKPIEFNKKVKGDGEIIDVPFFVSKDEESNTLVTCWHLSFTEIIRLLFNRRLWVSTLDYKNTSMPMLISTKKSDIFKK